MKFRSCSGRGFDVDISPAGRKVKLDTSDLSSSESDHDWTSPDEHSEYETDSSWSNSDDSGEEQAAYAAYYQESGDLKTIGKGQDGMCVQICRRLQKPWPRRS